MLVLTSHDNALFGGDFNDETPFAEITAPLRGLLSTRQARGDLSIVRTLDHLCPDLDNCNSEKDDRGWHNKAKWIFATLNLKRFKAPAKLALVRGQPQVRRTARRRPERLRQRVSWSHTDLDGFAAGRAGGIPPHPARVMAALNTANCAASIVCGQLANKKIAFSPTTGKMENYCDAWECRPGARSEYRARLGQVRSRAHEGHGRSCTGAGCCAHLGQVTWRRGGRTPQTPATHVNADPVRSTRPSPGNGIW